MTTAVATKTSSTLDPAVVRRGITEFQWRTLMNSLYPGAKGESVLMVWDYCLARHLDPMKKPCHIVPMEVKVGDRYEWRDVVMPGIYELRTTAQRTGQYLGHSEPEYSTDVVETKGVKAPEWCRMKMYRWNDLAKRAIEFPVRTFFREVVATKRDGTPNARWAKAPIQMLTKCCEAAGLREAFPDEIGGEQTAEEMDGQRAIDSTPIKVDPALVKPDGFEDWLLDLTSVADNGLKAFSEAWHGAKLEHRTYLAATEPETIEQLKTRAGEADTPKAEGE